MLMSSVSKRPGIIGINSLIRSGERLMLKMSALKCLKDGQIILSTQLIKPAALFLQNLPPYNLYHHHHYNLCTLTNAVYLSCTDFKVMIFFCLLFSVSSQDADCQNGTTTIRPYLVLTKLFLWNQKLSNIILQEGRVTYRYVTSNQRS